MINKTHRELKISILTDDRSMAWQRKTGAISTTPVLPENFIYFLMCLRITTGFFFMNEHHSSHGRPCEALYVNFRFDAEHLSVFFQNRCDYFIYKFVHLLRRAANIPGRFHRLFQFLKRQIERRIRSDQL